MRSLLYFIPNNLTSQRAVGVNQHFGISLDPLVKFVVRDLRVFDANLMAYNKGRFRLPSNDQISKISVVLLDIALPGGKRKPLRRETSA